MLVERIDAILGAVSAAAPAAAVACALPLDISRRAPLNLFLLALFLHPPFLPLVFSSSLLRFFFLSSSQAPGALRPSGHAQL